MNTNYPLEEKRVLKFGAKKYAPDKDFKEKSGVNGSLLEHLRSVLNIVNEIVSGDLSEDSEKKTAMYRLGSHKTTTAKKKGKRI